MVKSVPIIDLKRQYQVLKPEIDFVVKAVLESGSFILGENVRSLEEAVAGFCGVKFAVGVASGTDALELALRALGIKEGDEVITTPFTFIATVEAICGVGARPVFADIDQLTLNLNPERVRSKVTKKSRAVIPVHLYGCPAEMEVFTAIAAEYGLKIIEDCAQSLGSELKGKKSGSFGDCGCLSFFPTKNLGCCGDGGMVLTNSRDIADNLMMLRSHGSRERYRHVVTGYNSRLDEIQAAILKVKFKYLDEWNNARRRHAEKYNQMLSGLSARGCVILPVEPGGMKHTYCLYTIRVRAGKRDGLTDFLKAKGVQIAVHYPVPLHLQDVYSGFGYKKGDFPDSELAASEVLSLPLYPEITSAEIEYVCEAISEFFKRQV